QIGEPVGGAWKDEVVVIAPAKRAECAPCRHRVSAAIHKLDARIDEPEDCLSNELGHRLLEEDGANIETERPSEERRGHHLRGPDSAGGDNTPCSLFLRVCEHELVAPNL